MKGTKVTVLYYPPKFTNAGHIAVKIQCADLHGNYPPALEKILDFGGSLSEYQTREKFGDPVWYHLPPPPANPSYDKIINFVTEIDLSKFKLLSNNCTSSAIRLLTDCLGYGRILLRSTVCTPKNLKNQINSNYSLQQRINKILKYASEAKGWETTKIELRLIFQLDKHDQLKVNFQNLIDWNKVKTIISQLMKTHQNPRPTFASFFQSNDRVSERYKRLSKLLDIVNMYADPQHERLVNIREKQVVEEIKAIQASLMS